MGTNLPWLCTEVNKISTQYARTLSKSLLGLAEHLLYTCSIWRLICLTYFAAFAVGAMRAFCYDPLIAAYNTTTRSAQVSPHAQTCRDRSIALKLVSKSSPRTCLQERWAALHIRRSHSGIAFGVALLVMMYFCSWTTRLLTVFMGLIIVRCNLKPSEVTP